MKLHILVIGTGSSGQRFIELLLKARCKVSVYRHRPDLAVPRKCEILTNLSDLDDIDGVVVASPSNTHGDYLKALLPTNIPILMEKPLVSTPHELKATENFLKSHKAALLVGLNLRFLPCVQRITTLLNQKALGRILYVHLDVGKDLPSWRPRSDYTESYSAHYDRGGGVALDLIHELDLAYGWFPQTQFKVTHTDHISALKTDAEDYVQFDSVTKPWVRVTMDCLSHIKKREYHIVGDKGTLVCDVVNNYFMFKPVTGRHEKVTRASFFDIPASYETEVTEFLKLITNRTKTRLHERTLALDALKVALKARRYVP